jgi:2-methylcitrate dehydratase PrpD
MQRQSDPKLEAATRTISRFIAGADYAHLPSAITERVKHSILDTLGIIMPASVLMPDLKAAIDLRIEAGGKQESSILAYGVKVPCWEAAFANGVRGHALDYADGHLEAVFRVGISVIPAALAVAERIGGVSGKEFITAVAAAEEVLCRLGVSVARKRLTLGPWHCGILLGNFGATASAARILALNTDQIDRAFGIAFLQTGGTESVVAPDANIRGMYAGFVGQTGVLAALMSQSGVLGPRGCLESPENGLFDAYFHGRYEREALVDQLGSRFEVANLSFKPWPACAFAHPYIGAMLDLLSENHLRAEEIAEIEVFSGEMNWALCEPIDAEKGKAPSTTNDAKRSIPFNVAVAAARGKVSFRDFTPGGLRDGEVLRMAQKIRRVSAPELDEDKFAKKGNQLPPGKVRVKDMSGRTYVKLVTLPYGHHLNPIKASDIVEKFRDCVSFSPRPIPAADVERVIESILHLEEVADIREIIRLLA